jgi:hypothetical protein
LGFWKGTVRGEEKRVLVLANIEVGILKGVERHGSLVSSIPCRRELGCSLSFVRCASVQAKKELLYSRSP